MLLQAFFTCFLLCPITLFDFIEIGAFFGGAKEVELETRTHTYSTGAVYEGQWLDHSRHGTGTLTEIKGTKYVGEWEEGKNTA